MKRLSQRHALNIQKATTEAVSPVLKRIVGYEEDEDDDVISTRHQVANLNLKGASASSSNSASESHSILTD